jgi:hypothetical protein
MLSSIKMMRGKHFFLASCCLLLGAGCGKREKGAEAPPPSPVQTQSPPNDVCGLLTKEEIQSVQGSPITETKSSEHLHQGFQILQCYYSAQESSKSVVLSVTRSGPINKSSPKEYWEATFHGEPAQDKESGEEKEAAPPQKISGLGDEAYWSRPGVI